MNRDVLVIGAGILGLSSALHIKRLNPERSVAVVDRLPGPGQGNTAKSAGVYLNLFTTELNYFLGDTTIDWLSHLQNEMGYNLSLTQCGYLYLLDDARYQKTKSAIGKARKLGVEVETFEREDLERLLPELVTDLCDEESELMGLEPVTAGVLGVKCGSVDTDALAKSLEAEFLKLGGEIFYSTAVEEIVVAPEKGLGLPGEPFVWQDLVITGARTSRGFIGAGTTVVAAGVWSERLLASLGYDPLMRPKSRVIYVFQDPRLDGLRENRGFSGHGVLPFTQIPGISVYLKAEPSEGSLWLGCADDLGRGYGLEDDPQPERGLYEEDIYHALVRYLPCFRDVRPVNSWAGQRSVNSYDRTPVVTPAPGMIYVGSASGYGITKCDAVGRTAAAVYAGDDEVELFGGRRIKAAHLGIDSRKVGKETFKV